MIWFTLFLLLSAENTYFRILICIVLGSFLYYFNKSEYVIMSKLYFKMTSETWTINDLFPKSKFKYQHLLQTFKCLCSSNSLEKMKSIKSACLSDHQKSFRQSLHHIFQVAELHGCVLLWQSLRRYLSWRTWEMWGYSWKAKNKDKLEYTDLSSAFMFIFTSKLNIWFHGLSIGECMLTSVLTIWTKDDGNSERWASEVVLQRNMNTLTLICALHTESDLSRFSKDIQLQKSTWTWNFSHKLVMGRKPISTRVKIRNLTFFHFDYRIFDFATKKKSSWLLS